MAEKEDKNAPLLKTRRFHYHFNKWALKAQFSLLVCFCADSCLHALVCNSLHLQNCMSIVGQADTTPSQCDALGLGQASYEVGFILSPDPSQVGAFDQTVISVVHGNSDKTQPCTFRLVPDF